MVADKHIVSDAQVRVELVRVGIAEHHYARAERVVNVISAHGGTHGRIAGSDNEEHHIVLIESQRICHHRPAVDHRRMRSAFVGIEKSVRRIEHIIAPVTMAAPHRGVESVDAMKETVANANIAECVCAVKRELDAE